MFQDAVAHVARDQELKVLREMNELQGSEIENWSRGTV